MTSAMMRLDKENVMIDVSKAKINELVAYYNAHSGKSPIKKFADRKTAEKRVAALAPNGNGVPHSAVTVNGKQYRSVKQAFEALKLPLGRHIAFRMKLKAAGALKFDDKHEFKVVA